MTQDVESFTSRIAEIAGDLLMLPFQFLFYTYRTWATIDWYAPFIVMAYFFVSFILNKLIMSPVVALVFQQDKLEGTAF